MEGKPSAIPTVYDVSQCKQNDSETENQHIGVALSQQRGQSEDCIEI